MTTTKTDILSRLDEMTPQELKRCLAEELTGKRLGLNWEADIIERDKALNANLVLPRVDAQTSHWESEQASSNLIIEGDNFDSLRLLRATHRGCIRVIYIDPPYNTGNKDWVYNDDYVKKDDRWKHSKWLEFLYQRLTLARDLLTPDGVILISINDENRARLELLMDEVMPGRRIGSFVWKTRSGGNDAKGAFFSEDHEHILVYGNSDFSFQGVEKTYSIYSQDENGRAFYLSDLTSPKTFHERPNTYYAIKDPKTGIFYPCNPNRVWAYASINHDELNLRGMAIEEMIDSNLLWFPENQRVEVFETLSELREAISSGNIPYSGKTPLLWKGMPDIEQWLDVPIGFGRPRLKKFKDELKNSRSPVSSWISPKSEKESSNEPQYYHVGGTTEGTSELRRIFYNYNTKVSFPFPKPRSVLLAILDQATEPNDLVLDFFAGSGTTGHAVMDLNQQDGGNRSFILCSSTEATKKDPNKNICKDICAERIRRVATGYGDTPGIGGDFTYLTLDLVEEADLMFDTLPEHAYNLISLRATGRGSKPPADQPVWVVSDDGTNAIVVCPKVTDDTIAALKALNASRLIIYSPRPETVREAVEPDKDEVTSYSIENALKYAQNGNQSQAPSPEAMTEAGGSQ